eukprot:scpid97994/ scgid8947/ 
MMGLASAFQFILMFGLLFSVSSITAGSTYSGEDLSNGTTNKTGVEDSCMSRVLQHLPSAALYRTIQATELLLSRLTPSVDQLNAANADTASLSALLGGHQHAELLLQCLSGELEACNQRHPCNNAGKCIFSRSLEGHGEYTCKCKEGRAGKFCQTECLEEPTTNQQILHQVSKDVQDLKVHMATQEDIRHIETFLESINSTMTEMASKITSLNGYLAEDQENQSVEETEENASCER